MPPKPPPPIADELPSGWQWEHLISPSRGGGWALMDATYGSATTLAHIVPMGRGAWEGQLFPPDGSGGGRRYVRDTTSIESACRRALRELLAWETELALHK